MRLESKWPAKIAWKCILLVLFTILYFSATAQTTGSANTGGTGWKRIAYVNGQVGRGFGTVSLYVTGGDYTPKMTTINWFHDWSTSAGTPLLQIANMAIIGRLAASRTTVRTVTWRSILPRAFLSSIDFGQLWLAACKFVYRNPSKRGRKH